MEKLSLLSKCEGEWAFGVGRRLFFRSVRTTWFVLVQTPEGGATPYYTIRVYVIGGSFMFEGLGVIFFLRLFLLVAVAVFFKDSNKKSNNTDLRLDPPSSPWLGLATTHRSLHHRTLLRHFLNL